MNKGQNTDLNTQIVESRDPLESQKIAMNEFTHGNNVLSYYINFHIVSRLTLNTQLGKTILTVFEL